MSSHKYTKEEIEKREQAMEAEFLEEIGNDYLMSRARHLDDEPTFTALLEDSATLIEGENE